MSAAAVSDLRETMPDVVMTGPAIPLIGRAAEIGSLRAVWQRACDGDAGAVVLAGDAGIGKTRLVAEMTAEVRAAGGLALVGHCLGLGQAAPPFLPVLEILTQLRDATTDPDVAATAARLLQADVAGDQIRLFDGVQNVLVQAAQTTPVLVAVEDLHWSDPSTRDLLLFLLSRLGDSRVLVMLTYRSDDLNRQHPLRPWLAGVARMRGVERVDVEPLPHPDAVSFVRALVPADDCPADQALIDDVAARSEGNAFFAEELANVARGGGAELSDVLASVLLDRIERLSAPAQRVVRAAAIVGQRDLWASSLERLVGTEAVGLVPAEVEGALRDCVQSHVLVVSGDGAFAFRHALLREAVLADLLPGESARLHRAYATVLEQEQPSGWRAALAFHATRAGELVVALRARLGAAKDARAVAAHGDALAHLEQALQLLPAVPDAEQVAGADELTLVLWAGEAATASGRIDRAISYGREGVTLADRVGSVLQQAGARRRLAKNLYSVGDWREAERQIAQAWALLEDEPATAERAWVMSTMSFGESSPVRREMAERAIAEAREVGAPGPEADALISLAFLLQHEGDVDGAMDRLHEARERAREGQADDTELRAYFNIAILHLDRGELALAAEVAEEGGARALLHGRMWAGYGRELCWLRQVVDLTSGSFDAVRQRSQQWLENAAASARPMIMQTRAVAAAWQGDWDQVVADVASYGDPGLVARRILDGGGESSFGASAVLTSWLWQGRADEVIETITEAQVAPEFPDELIEVRVGAVLLTAYGDARRRDRRGGPTTHERAAAVDRALERVERIARDGVPRGHEPGPELQLWLARARAEAARARGQDDAELWRAVIEIAERGERPQEAVARWRLGEALLERDDASGAEQLSAAHELARAMGAAPLRTAVEATARRFRVPLAGARSSGADVLTPRERSVLELVARGLTNRAVGAELFISEKTVSVHLTRTMAKLGVASRTEAVAVAIARGLI